jgi:hypothetical protein
VSLVVEAPENEDADSFGRRPRPPRLICPPFRPAKRASSDVHSCAVPFRCAARPPLLAISRCFSGDIDANPRRSLRRAGCSPAIASAPLPAVRISSFTKHLRHWMFFQVIFTRAVYPLHAPERSLPDHVRTGSPLPRAVFLDADADRSCTRPCGLFVARQPVQQTCQLLSPGDNARQSGQECRNRHPLPKKSPSADDRWKDTMQKRPTRFRTPNGAFPYAWAFRHTARHPVY